MRRRLTVPDFFAVGALGRDVAEFRLDIDLRSDAVPRGQSWWCRGIAPAKEDKKQDTIHQKDKREREKEKYRLRNVIVSVTIII